MVKVDTSACFIHEEARAIDTARTILGSRNRGPIWGYPAGARLCIYINWQPVSGLFVMEHVPAPEPFKLPDRPGWLVRLWRWLRGRPIVTMRASHVYPSADWSAVADATTFVPELPHEVSGPG